MTPFEQTLLEAVPAPARRILVVGEALLRHRALWEQRNPLAAIAAEPAPGLDAAILEPAALGAAPAAAIEAIAGNLAPMGTLALFAAGPDHAAALAPLRAMAVRCGLKFDRLVEAASHGIVRFVHADQAPTPLHISALPLSPVPGTLNEGCARVRIHEPFEQLSSLPFVHCRSVPGVDIPEIVDRDAANLLIVQRPGLFNQEDFARRALADNWITIVEWDDLPSLDTPMDVEFRKLFTGCFHALQVTTPELAGRMRPFNPEVGVFGNHLPRIRPRPPKPSRRDGQPVRVLFAAANREAGWSEIVRAGREVLALYGDQVQTVVVADRPFFDQLQAPNGLFRPLLPYADYVAELEQADIVLLPLADTVFDRCKTDLKFIECAEAGAVVLASPIVYAGSVKSGETGMLYRNAYEFRQNLRTLIEDRNARERLAANAHRHVTEHRALANHIQRQADWYRSLVARKAELDRQVRERVGLS